MSEVKRMMDILLASLHLKLGAEADQMCGKAVYPGGAVPWDYGRESEDGCGGMMWVRMTSAHPTIAFPSQDLTITSCASTLAYELEMGILRPAPVATQFQKEWELPGDEDHDAAADKQLQDLETMRNAIRAAKEDIDFLLLRSYTPLGPAGGVVGGSWGITAGMDL